jgi:hypothetical protein
MLDTSRASGGAKYIQEQKEKDSLLHLELIVTSVARRPLVCDNVPPPTHPDVYSQSGKYLWVPISFDLVDVIAVVPTTLSVKSLRS